MSLKPWKIQAYHLANSDIKRQLTFFSLMEITHKIEFPSGRDGSVKEMKS